MEFKDFYKCRNNKCDQPANDSYSCCSISCRNLVPTCDVENCKNAVEGPSIYKGIDTYSTKCYNHGGRISYDGEPQNMKRLKIKYVRVLPNGKWVKCNKYDFGTVSI